MTRENETCKWCEFFDAGGLAEVMQARGHGKIVYGDCLSRSSPSYETDSAGTCDQFLRDTELDPLPVNKKRRS